MLKLVQLKYPSFPTKVTAPQATVRSNLLLPLRSSCSPSDELFFLQFMVREACYFAEDYQSEITSFADPSRMAAKDVLVQFPFVVPVSF